MGSQAKLRPGRDSLPPVSGRQYRLRGGFSTLPAKGDAGPRRDDGAKHPTSILVFQQSSIYQHYRCPLGLQQRQAVRL